MPLTPSPPDAQRLPLSPEFRTLIACVRDESPESLGDHLFAVGPDAGELLCLAGAHGVTSLLYLCLERKGLAGELPPDARARLATTHITLAARQTRMISVALEIIRALEHRGLRCLPLKGTALIAAAWPTYLPRDMVDLDLLVAAEDWMEAGAILEGRGFSPQREGELHCPWLAHGLPLLRDGMMLEPHTAPWGHNPMEPPFRPSCDQLWARARSGALLDQPVPVPSPEDMVLILLTGLARDRFSSLLRSWADLRWLLSPEGGGADTAVLWERAAALHAGKLLAICLRFAGELLGDVLPVVPECLDMDSAYGRVRPILWRRLLMAESLPRVPRSALRVLAGGRGVATEVGEAGWAWAAEAGGLPARAGRLGAWAGLVGGGLVYAGRLAVSRRARQALREEAYLLRAVREREAA